MIDATAKLSVSRQAIVLGISRGSVYYQPRPVLDADLKLMHRTRKLHMEFPFAGSRMLQGLLIQEGFKVGRLHVATLMKRMGIEALYRRPNPSKPAPGHKIYPYLLRKLPITRPNQVWAMDITLASERQSTGLSSDPPHPDGARLHLPRRRAGLVHPTGAVLAGVDHAGGRLLYRSSRGGAGPPWHPRNLQHGAWSRHRFERPCDVRAASSRRPSSSRCWRAGRSRSARTEKGAWRDNVFVKRLWRTIKYEAVYLRAYASVSEARALIGRYIGFYNTRRPHSSLDGETPDQAYFNPLLPVPVAA